jgi:hypothetical protein
MCVAVVALTVWLAAPAPLHAQNISGTILGTVTDTTGTSVPGAKVVIVNIENNQSNELLADQGGRYEPPLLKPGAYRVTASAKEDPHDRCRLTAPGQSVVYLPHDPSVAFGLRGPGPRALRVVERHDRLGRFAGRPDGNAQSRR